MTQPRIRWWVALVTGLLGVLACACSRSAAAPPQAKGPRTQATRAPKASSKTHSTQAAATAAATKSPATGTARQHPFVQVLDGQARRVGIATKLGPLTLKAVLNGPVASAIVKEGNTTHMVREGEYIGGLAVLSIREGEVVLGSGPRKRILSLYDAAID